MYPHVRIYMCVCVYERARESFQILLRHENYFQDASPPLMETDAMDSMLDSPTTSRAIDMMDLDPNMMDEPFDSGFLQSSAPIPIRSACVQRFSIFQCKHFPPINIFWIIISNKLFYYALLYVQR